MIRDFFRLTTPPPTLILIVDTVACLSAEKTLYCITNLSFSEVVTDHPNRERLIG